MTMQWHQVEWGHVITSRSGVGSCDTSDVGVVMELHQMGVRSCDHIKWRM